VNRSAFRKLSAEKLESRLLLAAAIGPVQPNLSLEQVIVSFRQEVTDARATAESFMGPLGGRLGHVYEHSLRGFSAQFPAVALKGIANHPLVKHVEADLVMQGFQTLPTGVDRIDAEVNRIGGMIGDGKSIDVDIAIIDSGIAPHPDLNVVDGVRFYTINSGPPRSRGTFSDGNYADDNGHGTHVAGIAAARDNGFGVVGVAPGARLWAVKVLNANNTGQLSDIIAGIDWVNERSDTIEIANMSLGGQGYSPALRTAIQDTVAKGVVFVVAAGNDWGDIHGLDKTFNTSDDVIPAAYPEVATIAAYADSDGIPGGLGLATSWGQYGYDDTWWGPSNFSNSNGSGNTAFLAANPVESPGLGIDLILPGVDILSTWPGGGYRKLSGTSMAAPHAAGLAALHIHQHGRAENAEQVAAIRQALIDGGKAWNSPEGLVAKPGEPAPWGPAAFMANIGWAGESTVTIAPVVSISSPSEGSVLAGTVNVRAMAEAYGDDNTITGVDFLVNGTWVGAMGFSSEFGQWFIEWDTNAIGADDLPVYPDQSYSLSVVATDGQERTAGANVNVVLDNIDDLPSVTVVSPVPGGVVSGQVTLAVIATDDRSVESVAFYVDGSLLGSGQAGGDDLWTLPWDTTGLADGTYNLRAVVRDNGGQSSEVTWSADVSNAVAPMSVLLTGASIAVNRNFWQGQATITVADSSHLPLAGVAVTGRWGGSGQLVSGITDPQGVVVFSSVNLRNNVSSVDFAIESLELADDEINVEMAIRIFRSGGFAVL